MIRAMFAVALVASVVAQVAAEVIDIVTEETSIEVGSSMQWSFGPVDTHGRTALLEWTARTQAASYSGSTYMLRVRINGQEVRAAKTRTIGRLRNKPMSYQHSPTLTLLWSEHGQWRIVYAPDFEVANQSPVMQGQAYRFVVDVTDLVRTDGPNTVSFEHLGTKALAARVGGEMPMVIGMMRLDVEEGESPVMQAEDMMGVPVNRGEPTPPPALYEHGAYNSGGFEITIAGETYKFETRISYPNAGYNYLEPSPEPEHEGQEGWSTSLQTGQEPLIVGRGPDYRVLRNITFGERKVEVSDTFVNLHDDQELGLIVRNQTKLDGERRVHLAGDPSPDKNRYYSPANPSVFIASKGHGVGIICEDDVFRNQATLFYDTEENAPGVMTDMLYLPPGGQETLRWSVYPVASEDYYDFINLVREDWGSNYTTLGPWAFFSPDTILDMPADQLRGYIEHLGLRYMVYCGGWVDFKNDKGPQRTIGFGTYVVQGDYWASFRQRLHDAIAKIHSISPDITCLVYYDTQRDSWPDAPERYPDSKLTNSAGQQLSTEWGGVYSLTWSMVATLEDSFGRAMLDAVDVYMNEIGADGLYWDEMECTGYGAPLITHSMPDGHSCMVNPETLTVDHQVGVTTLLGEGHRLAVIDKVRSMGGILMGNGPTCTRALLERQMQRMVEIQHNDTWCFEGNLDTPLGYASSRMDFGNFVRGVDLTSLLVGTSYAYQHEVSPHLFPFTPIELHAGYLLGRERIIATHSGNYGWAGERCLARVLHLSSEGMIVDNDFVTTIGEGARTAVELGPGEMIVLERLPVTFAPAAGEAMVRSVQYTDDVLRFVVDSDSGGTVRLQEQDIPVPPGHQTVTIDH